MNVSARFIRQAMVKEIAEGGQKEIEASTFVIDSSLPWCASAALYARASGVNVSEAPVAERDDGHVNDFGYGFSYAAPRHFAEGAFLVLTHIRLSVSA